MLLSLSTGWMLFSAVVIVFLYFFYRGFKKPVGKNDKLQAVTFLLLVILPILFSVFVRKAYVFTSKTNCKEMFVFAPFKFKFTNGSLAPVDLGSHYSVINNYNRDLECEAHVYSKSYAAGVDAAPVDIKAFSVMPIPNRIDFFPADSLPESAAIYGSTESVTKLWVHEKE